MVIPSSEHCEKSAYFSLELIQISQLQESKEAMESMMLLKSSIKATSPLPR